MAKEEEKGKGATGTSEDSSQKLSYSKDDLFNPVVEYNIAVLYSYTKNFAYAIDNAVKLLVELDFNKDPYIFFKTAFFLLVNVYVQYIRTYWQVLKRMICRLRCLRR